MYAELIQIVGVLNKAPGADFAGKVDQLVASEDSQPVELYNAP